MKRIIAAIATAHLISCSPKTETKVVGDPPGVVLGEPPFEAPEGDVPPLKRPTDDVIQNDEVENWALADSLALSDVDARNTVYLSGANFANDGSSVETAIAGTELGVNLLSNESFIEKGRPIGGENSILAVDLRDFFGSQSDAVWRLIEDQAIIKIESQTQRFRQLQFLTQKRLPIVHMQIFLETAFLSPVYYAIKNVPQNENQFWLQQGINRQRDFDDRDKGIYLAGFQESQIGPDNRVVRRMEGREGSCWNSYDVDSLNLVAESNFFRFPFPIEARSQLTLRHAAGEILCVQRNGLFVMALYNGAGVRQDAAPTTVVVNTRTAALGLDPSIVIRDCVGCHTQYVLPVRDELRRQVQDSPFGANDKLLAQLFFKPQAQLDAITEQDNARYADTLGELNIESGGIDPMNVGVIDKIRDGMDAKELAAFLYISEGELLTGLAGSDLAQQEVGQLLQGGTIGFNTIKASLNAIIDDLNLFRDIE